MTDGDDENIREYILLRSSEGRDKNGNVAVFLVDDFFDSCSSSASEGYVEG